MSALAERRERREPALVRSFVLALLVHLVLVAIVFFGRDLLSDS